LRLPVITSVNNGGSQIITEGVDGFVLSDPRDTIALSMLLRRLYQDRDLCALIGKTRPGPPRATLGSAMLERLGVF